MGRRKLKETIQIQNLKFNAAATQKPIKFTGTQSLGAPSEVLKWQVELHDLGRQLKGELDSKMLAVTQLTRQCDQASQRLSDMIQLAEQVGSAGDSPLAKAQQLSRDGWPTEKIARVLALSVDDTETLLAPASSSTCQLS
ncbi:MAG: hypothetical protein Aurels2KO_03390 [Aureliella sp.]